MTFRLPAAVSLAALLLSGAAAAAPDVIPVEVTARPIEHFRIGSDRQRFGELEFAGGLDLSGSSRHFGALSAVHLHPGGSRMMAVADTGFWLAANIDRDPDGRPVGLSDVAMWEMTNGAGKWETDAEGMTATGDTIFVSYERTHRIAEFALDDDGFPVLRREAPPPVALHELRTNRGFEAVAIVPDGQPLAGSLVGVSEKSLDGNRNIMAFLRRPDGSSFEFSVKRVGEFDVTDGQFLPDGDLVLLERRFNITDGVAMRLRRIAAGAIAEGATVDGEVLLEADLLYQIDNMEGLSITVDPDGTPRLTIVSDDNHSILQRNLLLEFRLVGAEDRSG
ncbi:esterase-like activity of phytase family protein [Oricola thermophila]|uniref:esterase-like activity of phytase family protein n=1 Tax=Oricola thermophila TaxID=2742145 RepID=UPI001FEAD978|nr:esterase-like activity of phytase family protein [Oricola thermophila]